MSWFGDLSKLTESVSSMTQQLQSQASEKAKQYIDFIIDEVKRYQRVTCGRCGALNNHDLNQEDVTCQACNFTSDPCDFPDYDGI